MKKIDFYKDMECPYGFKQYDIDRWASDRNKAIMVGGRYCKACSYYQGAAIDYVLCSHPYNEFKIEIPDEVFEL